MRLTILVMIMNDLAKQNVDLSELEEFETPVDTRPVKPVHWSLEKYCVAQSLCLEGKSRTKISEETGIPLSTIRKWEKHPDFQAYMQELVLKQKDLLLAIHLQDLAKTLHAKRQYAEDNDDWKNYSRQDPTKIMETFHNISGSKEESEQSNYAKMMEMLLEKSNKAKTIEIESE